MNGHVPSDHPQGLEQLKQALSRLPDAALVQMRAHLDAIQQHRMQHGDDPTEAPES